MSYCTFPTHWNKDSIDSPVGSMNEENMETSCAFGVKTNKQEIYMVASPLLLVSMATWETFQAETYFYSHSKHRHKDRIAQIRWLARRNLAMTNQIYDVSQCWFFDPTHGARGLYSQSIPQGDSWFYTRCPTVLLALVTMWSKKQTDPETEILILLPSCCCSSSFISLALLRYTIVSQWLFVVFRLWTMIMSRFYCGIS